LQFCSRVRKFLHGSTLIFNFVSRPCNAGGAAHSSYAAREWFSPMFHTHIGYFQPAASVSVITAQNQSVTLSVIAIVPILTQLFIFFNSKSSVFMLISTSAEETDENWLKEPIYSYFYISFTAYIKHIILLLKQPRANIFLHEYSALQKPIYTK